MEKAIKNLSMSLNIHLPNIILEKIRHVDIDYHNLTSETKKMIKTERELKTFILDVDKTNKELILNLETENEMKFDEEFTEYQEDNHLDDEGNDDIEQQNKDVLDKYILFLDSKLQELDKDIADTHNKIKIEEASQYSKEKIEEMLDEYKSQKFDIRNYTSKLQSKFITILKKSEESFNNIQESLKNYSQSLSEKQNALMENSTLYYNLRSALNSKVPDHITETITSHQKYLKNIDKASFPIANNQPTNSSE